MNLHFNAPRMICLKYLATENLQPMMLQNLMSIHDMQVACPIAAEALTLATQSTLGQHRNKTYIGCNRHTWQLTNLLTESALSDTMPVPTMLVSKEMTAGAQKQPPKMTSFFQTRWYDTG